MKHVAIVPVPTSQTFQLHTTGLFPTIIGPRLWKCDLPWPDLPVRDLTANQAAANAEAYEEFFKRQEAANRREKRR